MTVYSNTKERHAVVKQLLQQTLPLATISVEVGKICPLCGLEEKPGYLKSWTTTSHNDSRSGTDLSSVGNFKKNQDI